jgi:hypothetical protein
MKQYQFKDETDGHIKFVKARTLGEAKNIIHDTWGGFGRDRLHYTGRSKFVGDRVVSKKKRSGKKARLSFSSKTAILKIIASKKQGFWLVYPNAAPLRTSKEKAQKYFDRLKVLKKYKSTKYQGKIYHLGK